MDGFNDSTFVFLVMTVVFKQNYDSECSWLTLSLEGHSLFDGPGQYMEISRLSVTCAVESRSGLLGFPRIALYSNIVKLGEGLAQHHR